jgi:hypothetical protein
MRTFTRTVTLPLILCLASPAIMLAQQQQLPPQEVLEDEHEPEPTAVDDPNAPVSSHATVEAPPELIGLISREPERVIGKTLVLSEGTQTKPVGPVLAVRKQVKDQRAYMIVDATQFFNSPTQYAVAVGALDRIEGDRLITPAAPGMHLLGQQYYAEDYEDLPQPVAPAPED